MAQVVGLEDGLDDVAPDVRGEGRVEVDVRPVLGGQDDRVEPDGLAVDGTGAVWVAGYGAGTVWRLRGGQVVGRLDVPTPQVTSVAVGGASGTDLLITTAREHTPGTPADGPPDPAGRVFWAPDAGRRLDAQ